MVVFAGICSLILLFTVVGQPPSGVQSGAGGLQESTVPSEYVPWVLRAGSLCVEISPALIAAQDQVESGWNPGAVSPAGAEGIAQFLPSTFPSWGRDDDGTGHVTPFNLADAIMAQGRYDCSLAALMTRLVSSGAVTGSVVDLALAAYNAGPGQVEEAHGVPADAASYVRDVESLASSKYAGRVIDGSGSGAAAVSAAESALGTPYHWGGSCTDPHGSDPAGWCDCSSLMQMAWAAAGTSLPRTTFEQAHAGTSVAAVAELQPGDLVFIAGADGTASTPGHVGMYVGGGYLIHAPQTGEVVQFVALSSWQGLIVAMRHIG